MDSCTRMHELVTAARERIDAASLTALPRDEASRSAIDRDASEVSDRVRAVRQHANDVKRKAGAYGTLNARDVKNLDTNFSGRHANLKVRREEFRRAASLLDSVDTRVESILHAIEQREKALYEELVRYSRNERERFRGQRGP